MKHVETNFLIYDLAKKGNKNKFYSPFKFLFSLITLNCLYIILYLLNVELRLDLQDVLSSSIFSVFYLQIIVFSAGVILGTYLLYKQAIPGQAAKLSYKVLSFLFYFFWASLLVMLSFIAYKHNLTISALKFDYSCINRTLLAMLFPLVTSIYFVKKGYVLEQRKAMLIAILVAYSFASFINLLVCAENNALHILLLHYAVLLPVITLLFGVKKLLTLIKKG